MSGTKGKNRLFGRPTALGVPLQPLGSVRPAAPVMEPLEEPTIRVMRPPSAAAEVPKLGRSRPEAEAQEGVAPPPAVPAPPPAAPAPPPAAPPPPPAADEPTTDPITDEERALFSPGAVVESGRWLEEASPEAETLREEAFGGPPPVEELVEVDASAIVAPEAEADAALSADFDTPRHLEPWERRVVPVARPLRALVTPPPPPRAGGAPPPPPNVSTVSPAAAPTVDTATAHAPGKVILMGEHAVVYGHRAIAAAVGLGTSVTLRRRRGPSRVESSAIDDPRLGEALAAVIPAEGIGVTIRSDLPVGCGMGSSAALAVATVRALARLEGREASLRECVDKGFLVERVFHGNPSGLDHTVSASGGALIYRRGEPAEELRVTRPLRVVIANTGVPGNTADMVERVRQRNPTELLTRIGALVEMTAVRLARGEPVGEFVREAHRMLRLMGVSTPALDDLCRALEGAGSTGAKLAGAGGGGVVIALVDAASEAAVRRAAEPLAPGGVWVTEIGAGQGGR